MMKKVILLSVLAVSLTGCVVDPWDDDYRGNRDLNGHYDADHRNHDWKERAIKIIGIGNVTQITANWRRDR